MLRIESLQLTLIGTGIGRSAALKYSELGFTVFALCPDNYCVTSSPVTRPRRSSDVSSASKMLPTYS